MGEAALLEPEAVLRMNTGELRACGLSERKASYILDLAGRFASDQLSTARIAAMDDDMLFAELSAVKGIGAPRPYFDSGQGQCIRHAVVHSPHCDGRRALLAKRSVNKDWACCTVVMELVADYHGLA